MAPCGAPDLTAGLTGKLVCRCRQPKSRSSKFFPLVLLRHVRVTRALDERTASCYESARLLGRVKFGNDGPAVYRPFDLRWCSTSLAIAERVRRRSITVAAPGVCIVPTSWTEGRGVWGVPSG